MVAHSKARPTSLRCDASNGDASTEKTISIVSPESKCLGTSSHPSDANTYGRTASTPLQHKQLHLLLMSDPFFFFSQSYVSIHIHMEAKACSCIYSGPE